MYLKRKIKLPLYKIYLVVALSFISAPHFPAPHEPAANADVAASKTPNNNPDNFIFIVILIPLNLIYLVV